jgi:hypothetical protein
VKPEGTVIDHVTALYCITDDLLKAVGHREDARRTMCDAEVLTTALTTSSSLFCGLSYYIRDRRRKGIGLHQNRAEQHRDSDDREVGNDFNFARQKFSPSDTSREKEVSVTLVIPPGTMAVGCTRILFEGVMRLAESNENYANE